jgi:glutathione S-transferase
MKLYDCQIAPNPRRVRIFLAEKGVEIERVELNIAEGDNLKPDFLAINPRGLLPTLILDDGMALDEVVAISRWIEETWPDPPLMGRTPATKRSSSRVTATWKSMASCLSPRYSGTRTRPSETAAFPASARFPPSPSLSIAGARGSPDSSSG